MKKIIYLLPLFLLFVQNLQAQILETSFSPADLTINSDPTCPIQVAPEAEITVSWNMGNCAAGVTYEFSNFDLIPNPGSGIEILPGTASYCWTQVGDAALDPCITGAGDPITELTFGTFTFFPSEGEVNTTLEFFVPYFLPDGIPTICIISMEIPPFVADCPCEDLNEAIISFERKSCAYDDCSGEVSCLYKLNLDFFYDGEPASPNTNYDLEIEWYRNGVVFDIGSYLTSTEVVVTGPLSEISIVLHYANYCPVNIDPVILPCDGLPECTGIIGNRLVLDKTLDECELSPTGDIVCTYTLSLQVNPNMPSNFVNLETYDWTVDGTSAGTGNAITVTVNGGETLPVSVAATGTANGGTCDWEEETTLECTTSLCDNPCPGEEAWSIVSELLDCETTDCEGCLYRFSLADLSPASLIENISWVVSDDYAVLAELDGTEVEVCAVSQTKLRVIARVEYISGCVEHNFLEVICDDLACENCEIEATLECSEPAAQFCLFEFNVTDCDLYNIEGNLLTFDLSICDPEVTGGNCLLNIEGALFGGYYYPIYLSAGEKYEVAYEVFLNGVSIYTFTADADCTEGVCPELRGDGEEGGERSAESVFSKTKLSISPNPVAEVLELRGLENWKDAQQISIYNINGQLEYEQVISSDLNTQLIEVATLNNGLYCLLVRGNQGVIHQQLITVLR